MIKTAIIIERADISLGGAERSVVELAEALSALGVTVRILAAKGMGDSADVEIVCGDAAGKRVGLAGFGKAILKHLDANEYDIIHSMLPFDFADIYQPRGGAYPEAAKQNAASYDNPAIRVLKSRTHFLNLRRTALLKAEENLCRKSQKTIVAALSEYVKRQFKEWYDLADERIVVIPNGVKIDTAVDELGKRVLSMLGVVDDSARTLFLLAAYNFRLKGLSNLLKAMGELENTGTETAAYLVVAGSGKRAKYLNLARRLGVEDRVVFVGALSDIHQALAITDIAVLPTYYDPCSRFILESLAQAKPVITTRFNGAAERYTDGRHGRIIEEPGDVRALAEAMRFLCRPQNAQNAAKAIVEDNLKNEISIANHAEQVVKLYEMILSERTTD